MLLIGLAILTIPTLVAAYYAWFAWLARSAPANPPTTAPRVLAIIIPAHNEQATIREAIQSVQQSDYPADCIDLLVVADNCSDSTAALARGCGATVLERQSETQRGKGYALAEGLQRVLARKPGAVLILDSDCQLKSDTLSQLNNLLAAGHPVIQTAVHIRNGAVGPAALVAAIGGEVENNLSAGFSATGKVVHLRGTGMIFSREILERHPWKAFGLTEDAEYSETLRRAGVRVHFSEIAAITTDAPLTGQSLAKQRSRWRESLFVDRSRLLHRWLMSKPLVVGQFLVCAALALLVVLPTGDLASIATVGGWILTLALIWTIVFGQATAQLRLPLSAYVSLLGAPVIVGRLAGVTLLGLLHRGGSWQRTERAAVQDGLS